MLLPQKFTISIKSRKGETNSIGGITQPPNSIPRIISLTLSDEGWEDEKYIFKTINL